MKKYVTIISTFLLVSCTVGGQLSQLQGPDDLIVGHGKTVVALGPEDLIVGNYKTEVTKYPKYLIFKNYKKKV